MPNVSKSLAMRQPCGTWLLDDAQANLDEVCRRAIEIGPQRVLMDGHAVVLVSEDMFDRWSSAAERTGSLLVDAVRTSPLRDLEFDNRPEPGGSAIRPAEKF